MTKLKELTDFLKTIPQDAPIQMVYDGHEQELIVFWYEGILCFSHRDISPQYQDSEILFRSDHSQLENG